MPATITTLFTDTITTTAVEKFATDHQFWVGYSGETTLGEDVAAHLDAVLALLETRGWARTATDPEPELPTADESKSVKSILLSLVQFFREMNTDRGPLTLPTAMIRVLNTPAGDADTWVVAGRVMDALLLAYTGASFAASTAWTTTRDRTWAEVRELLTASAQFARDNGPRN